MNPPFAAVLLAGGRSRRMGRDKALLPLPDGRLLWERQLGVLRALGPAELFISGPAREGFPPDVPLLADEVPGLGPLAGMAAALGAMRAARLIVLAVDLPAMTSRFLHDLLATGRGIVPRAASGYYEPLAAVYPGGALSIAKDHLRGEDRSLQSFVRTLVEGGLVAAHPVVEADAGLFVNWNGPGDLPR